MCTGPTWIILCHPQRHLFLIWLILQIKCRLLTSFHVRHVCLCVEHETKPQDGVLDPDHDLTWCQRHLVQMCRREYIRVTFVNIKNMFHHHGFMSRFLVLEAYPHLFHSTEHVCFLDDDLFLSPSLYTDVWLSYLQDTRCIVSLFGRNIRNTTYVIQDPSVNQCQNIDIALTKCLCVRKQIVLNCIQKYHHDSEIRRQLQSTCPKGNGEDIVLSLSSPHKKKCFPVTERLGRYIDIGSWASTWRRVFHQHVGHRTRLVNIMLSDPKRNVSRDTQ